VSGTDRKRSASGPIRSAPFRSAAYRTSVAATRICASFVREAPQAFSCGILSWYERFNFTNNSLCPRENYTYNWTEEKEWNENIISVFVELCVTGR